MSSFPQQYSYVDSGRFQYGYDREEYPYHYHSQTDNGVMSSYAQPQSRTNSRPRVSMACEHCRKRKVRCDGKKPSCGLCSRLSHVTCVYVKVTPEQNAVLREKKRQSKQRKNAEQEAARANFHKHDTFPAYHPYRNVGLPTQSGGYRNGSFASSIVEDINNQRVSCGVVGMPNAPALPQTSSVLQPYQTQQQQQSSGSGAYFYDGRYQAAPSTSTSTAANALFDVGAGLNSAPRRPSVMAPYARKQSFEVTAVTTTATAGGWSRASEPRSSFSSSTSSYRYDTIPTDTSLPTSTAGGGLNILTPIPHSLPSTNTSTSYYTNTFRSDPEPQRYMSAFAPHPTTCSSSAGFECTSPPIATPTPTQSYFEPQNFRPPSSNSRFDQSVSPHSVTSPSHLSSVPHLERAPSSLDSGSAASPASHHEDMGWSGKQNWEFTAGEDVTNWASVNHNSRVAGGKWDPVVSIYLQSHTPV